MNFKLSICALVACIFFFSSSYAQNWQRFPRSSETFNQWRNRPQISKYPGPKYGWQKDGGHNRSRSWKHKPKYLNRRVWLYNPIYWRYSGLGYQREGNESAQKLVIELMPDESYEGKELLPQEKKEFTKPQIETVSEEALAAAKSIDQNSHQESAGITIIGSEGSIQIENNVQVRSLETQAGPVKIYCSD